MTEPLMISQLLMQEVIGELTPQEVKNAPNVLFYQGDKSLLLDGIRVSVVGSRACSQEGQRRAQMLTRALVGYGFTVVSGLAEGIDTFAHQTAIDQKGKTIAVLGTPLDEVYPKSNAALLETIKEQHLAISQFAPGFSFNKKNFPIRNRTMALISDATIIVEAQPQSGTRHQGWEALRLGRMVFLLQNVVDNEENVWAHQMLDYGALILTRENLEDSLLSIPSLTSRKEIAF